MGSPGSICKQSTLTGALTLQARGYRGRHVCVDQRRIAYPQPPHTSLGRTQESGACLSSKSNDPEVTMQVTNQNSYSLHRPFAPEVPRIRCL